MNENKCDTGDPVENLICIDLQICQKTDNLMNDEWMNNLFVIAVVIFYSTFPQAPFNIFYLFKAYKDGF